MYCTLCSWMVNDVNRSEWSPIWSVKWLTKSNGCKEGIIMIICQSPVWLWTELDCTKSCYQLIINITISGKKKHLGQTSLVKCLIKSKSFSILEIPQMWVVVAIVIVINSVFGGFRWVNLVWLVASTVELQVFDYGQMSDYTVWLQL